MQLLIAWLLLRGYTRHRGSHWLFSSVWDAAALLCWLISCLASAMLSFSLLSLWCDFLTTLGWFLRFSQLIIMQISLEVLEAILLLCHVSVVVKPTEVRWRIQFVCIHLKLLPYFPLVDTLLSFVAFQNFLCTVSIVPTPVFLADIYIAWTITVRLRASRRRKNRVFSLLSCTSLHKWFLRHTASLLFSARFSLRSGPHGLTLTSSFWRDRSGWLLAFFVSTKHRHWHRFICLIDSAAHHLCLNLVRYLPGHVFASLKGALTAAATFLALLLPLDSAILQFLIETLHLGKVSILQFV